MDNNLNEQNQASVLPNKLNNRYLVVVIIAALALLAITWLIFSANQPETGPVAPEPVAEDFAEILRKSTSGENSAPLQNYFVEQMKAGNNDDTTKSAIYWITHRYFDNGGNIYEIYDFVESHPEVSFLKEAENIYPSVFEQVRAKTVQNYSRESLLALLSYYQVIDTHGYAGLAIWGLAANKYSEQALMNLPQASDPAEVATQRATYFEMTQIAASHFAAKARQFIMDNTKTTGRLSELELTSVLKEDLLVGLNQYASAIANLKGSGVEFFSPLSVAEIFEYTSTYALNEIPRLYFFTNYLYATALLQSGDATPNTVAASLGRVVEYAEANPDWRVGGSIERVVNSKNKREASVFSYENSKALAALNPQFKDWLKKHGWTESDF